MAQELGTDGNTLALITGAIVTIVVAGKQAFDRFSPDSKRNIKEAAELDIIKTLREEVDRVKEDLQNIKEEHSEHIRKLEEDHKEERITLMSKIECLNDKFSNLNKDYEKLKRELLEVYIQASNVHSFEELELLKEKLIAIIDGDSSEV